MWKRMAYPSLYRVRIADASATIAREITVLTWLGEPKAEWFGKEIHRSMGLDSDVDMWPLDTIEVTDLGPAPKDSNGFYTGPEGFLDDQTEW